MWQGREIILCTLALLAGNLLGDALSLPPLVYLLLSVVFALVAWRRPQLLWILACLLWLGAAGVQFGTRFAVAKECTAHPEFKQALLKASARDAQATSQFDPALNVVSVRALRNEGTLEFERLQLQLLSMLNSGRIGHDEAQAAVEHFWVGGLRRAAVEGDVVRGSVMAGQSVGLVTKEQSVAEIIAELVGDCEAELRRCRERLQ